MGGNHAEPIVIGSGFHPLKRDSGQVNFICINPSYSLKGLGLATAKSLVLSEQ